MSILDYKSDGLVFFDGAMGATLDSYGLKAGAMPDNWNIDNPNIIREVQAGYIKAGSDIIITNTFNCNNKRLPEHSSHTLSDVLKAGIQIARDVARDKFVALDIGPIGQLLEPSGALTFDEAYEIFKEQIIIGASEGVDLILFETMSDIYEMKAAVLAAKENSNLPIFATLTFQDDNRTLMGTDPITAITTLESFGVDALGLNCSLGPKELLPIVEEIVKYATKPLIVQPNAGLPKLVDGKTVFDISPDEFTDYMKIIAQSGVKYLGGCCGTTKEHIGMMANALRDYKYTGVNNRLLTTASSFGKTVILNDNISIVGENINPTGNKKLRLALSENRIDYVLNEGIKQKEAGADVLDINLGLPDIDEKTAMVDIVKKLQSIIDTPLQIDSSKPDVIESAVRYYNGKPIINSVNGKKESMDAIFPIIKKYGASVVALTLDSGGIPETMSDRLKVAEKILVEAEKYGIPKENIIFDTLTLSAASNQSMVIDGLKTISKIRDEFGLATTLGVSNISFGLPNRNLITKTFMITAFSYGLNMPIINPLKDDFMGMVLSYKILNNTDTGSVKYIEYISQNKIGADKSTSSSKDEETRDLKEMIIKGLKEKIGTETKTLLEKEDPSYIISNYLIPALNIVGDKFGEGKLFLPQLIQSAECVKKAFEIIKYEIASNPKFKDSEDKEKIILATVYGDIHDIGKNIVKVLLENYGYEIIDLGRDVPIATIVETVEKHNVKLVGLSALMTTTASNMEEAIRILKSKFKDIKIMVGGAVLTKTYSEKINADYYAKDAQESVVIANNFFGK